MVASNIGDVAFAIQTAKGAAATVSTNRLYMSGGTQPHSNFTKAEFEETSGMRMLSDAYIGEVSVIGDPEFFVMPESIAPLLYGVLGAQAISGAADPWTHTFIPADSLPYFTFWRMLANGLAEKFVDCIITKLTLSGTSGAPLRVTVSIIGLVPSFLTPAEATATVEKTNRFMHSDASGALLVEGTAVSCVRDFSLEIDNGAQTIPGDSITPCDISVGRLSVMASTTQLVSSFTLWNRLHYGSATPTTGASHVIAPLELAGSPAGISWTWTRIAATRTLKIAIPRVQIDPFDDQPSISGDPLLRDVTYRAYQPAAGASVTGTVLNAKAVVY